LAGKVGKGAAPGALQKKRSLKKKTTFSSEGTENRQEKWHAVKVWLNQENTERSGKLGKNSKLNNKVLIDDKLPRRNGNTDRLEDRFCSVDPNGVRGAQPGRRGYKGAGGKKGDRIVPIPGA